MRVPENINRWEEASPYLDMLAHSIINDVCPLLNLPGGAPHAIAREVFSYVHYLGALYVGTEKVPLKHGLAEVGVRFKKYLKEVMATTDPNYDAQAEVIYNMYRNGPVHEFDPKVLKNKKQEELGWYSYREGRQYTHVEWKIAMHHLYRAQSPKDSTKFCLPVSSTCLIQDLLESIERFKRGIGDSDERVHRWNQTAAVLNRPKDFEFA